MKKILVVDDSVGIRKTVSQVLTKNYPDLKVIEAEDGNEALLHAVLEKPDMILLDVEMPKLNGIQTCDLLKTNSDTSDIPVVFLTTKDTVFDYERGKHVGCSDYMTKPFMLDQFIEVVERVDKELNA